MSKRERQRAMTGLSAGRGGHSLGDLADGSTPRVRADTRISAAWTVFLDRSLQWVTVVDELGRPVGVLMRSDLAEAVLDDTPTVPGMLLDELDPPARAWHDQEPAVDEVMRCSVNTLPSTASLEDAAAVLEVAELSEVVVVDEGGRMMGVVSADDLVPYLPSGARAADRRASAGGRAAIRR